ncbi:MULTISPECIES: class F sortase [unclassified Streptomyces]|uniref:class F sortase n=1 Tax=unclassified Streptomyces TaxID=2593676 RepID=UPI00224FC160|nr:MULTISPECIES: class F sortase [unclassified Streptomyces]MCX4827246.1 class F sortase [Streptomyces sp. NBC_01016]
MSDRSQGAGRLLTGVAWVVLLLGLWLWGHGATDLNLSSPTTGDAAAVGRPSDVRLPAAHEPVEGADPRRVDIAALRIQAPVVARGLDAGGAIDPPPYARAGVVGWYSDGVRPGERGTSLFVGHVDTERRPAVFYHLSEAEPGDTVRVTRSDGSVAEFTVDDVRVFSRENFDPAKAYGPHRSERAELRLITCGGSFDKASGTYSANVIVSAYLSGLNSAPQKAS